MIIMIYCNLFSNDLTQVGFLFDTHCMVVKIFLYCRAYFIAIPQSRNIYFNFFIVI